MYVSTSATASGRSAGDAARTDVSVYRARNATGEQLQTVIYLDSRAFIRDCIGDWLQSSLSGFSVCVLPDADQIAMAPLVNHRIRAVLVNAGGNGMSSTAMARLLSRLGELLPDCPVAVLSDHEDPHSIREAFDLGVRGYIPTSLEALVVVEAVRLVCAGGTFAPAAALLCQPDHWQRPAVEMLLKNLTPRQWQILDCLRRGMTNKRIAYELNMCESTVKVHLRNIMKKLNAANRTEVAYLTSDLFQSAAELHAL